MTLLRKIQRGVAGVLGVAGLAYPACAALCPRGIGGCLYPGRCLLFTDADANSLCDYTSHSLNASATPVASSPPATPPPIPSSVPLSPGTSADPGLVPGTLPLPLLAGVATGILTCLLLFLIFRSGVAGSRVRKTGPALAASSLFALGTAEVVTFLLMSDGSAGSLFAAVYMVAGSLLAGYLWRSGCISRPLAIGTVLMSTLFGFVFLTPLMPVEFAGVVTLGMDGSHGLLLPGIAGLLVTIALAFLFGRVFCGHLCPVGSVQELAWSLQDWMPIRLRRRRRVPGVTRVKGPGMMRDEDRVRGGVPGRDMGRVPDTGSEPVRDGTPVQDSIPGLMRTPRRKEVPALDQESLPERTPSPGGTAGPGRRPGSGGVPGPGQYQGTGTTGGPSLIPGEADTKGFRVTIHDTHALEAVRVFIFGVTVISALFFVDLMAYLGISDFFSLVLSAGSLVFVLFLLLSVIVYRPVCRVICPFGFLFSLPAHVSHYRLRRTEACINCGRCEKACPTLAAGPTTSKRECYLCARCTQVCPVEGALVYRGPEEGQGRRCDHHSCLLGSHE